MLRTVGFYQLKLQNRFGKPIVFHGAVAFGAQASGEIEVLRILVPMPTPQLLHEALGQVHSEPSRERLFFRNATSDDVLKWLQDYCDHGIPLPDVFDPAVARLEGLTLFQRVCYELSLQIGHGDTRSYSWMAERLRKQGAERAVGGAMKNNPFPLLIPCHRVLKKDGTLGGYLGVSSSNAPVECWQLLLKKAILEIERSHQQPSLFHFSPFSQVSLTTA